MTRDEFRAKLAERIYEDCKNGIPSQHGTKGPALDDIACQQIATIVMSEIGRSNLGLYDHLEVTDANRT